MFLKIQLSPSENRFRSQKQNIMISLCLQNIAERCNAGEKMLLRIHFVHSAALVHDLRLQTDLQRKTAGLSEHSTHGERRTWLHMSAFQFLGRT